jgi:anti-sigma regulatory factor (Ser/Thr protein kinase)
MPILQFCDKGYFRRKTGPSEVWPSCRRGPGLVPINSPSYLPRSGSMSTPKHLTCEIGNTLAEIVRLAAEVEDFGTHHHLPAAVVSHLNLALDELLTNTISYGYDEGVQDRIQVTVEMIGNEISIELSDGGKPFDPREGTSPDTRQSVEDRPIGGLGLFLVGKMMDRVDYRRSSNRNCVRLIKTLKDSGNQKD